MKGVQTAMFAAVLLVLLQLVSSDDFGINMDGWTELEDWVDKDECSVLCGGGEKEQILFRYCEYPPCNGRPYLTRTVPCGYEPCGDLCRQGKVSYLPHPISRSRFYQCSNGIPYLQRCAKGTVFDRDDHRCTHKGSRSCPAGKFTLLPDFFDCTKYYVCDHGKQVEKYCPPATRFDEYKNTCVHDDGKCSFAHLY